MPDENTQYGLKNHLNASSLEKLNTNLYRSKLTHISGKELYLYILVLSENIIRFHYSFDESFDIKKPNQHLEFQNFETSTAIATLQSSMELCTSTLKIKIQASPLQIQIFDNAGNLLSSDEPGLGFWSEELDYDSHEIRCYKQYSNLKNPPLIYGLGDKTGSINRWGRRFRNAPIDALGYDSEYTDPLYKDIPFFIHLDKVSKQAHGIFFDNFHEKFFDFGRERKPSPYYYFGASGGELNYYFIHGPAIRDVVSRYLEITGRPPEWPSFTYGYLASGMSYTENEAIHSNKILDRHVAPTGLLAMTATESLLKAFNRFSSQNIPATAFHLSSGYIQDSHGQRQQFIWNTKKFPDSKAFSKQAKDLGVELCANVKPVLLTTHPWYQEAARLGLFIQKPTHQNLFQKLSDARHASSEDTESTETSMSSPRNEHNAADENFGASSLIVDYWGGQGSYLDYRKPATQAWWKEKLQQYILANGVRGIWNDNNEYEIFEPHSAHGHTMEMQIIMAKLAWEAGSDWVLSRSGYAGIQKYAQSWTGDNYSSWKSLQYDNAILSSCGLSGLIHMGVDIGGFWGDTPDSELLLRWIQNGVFTPRFCIHSYKETPTEPDMYASTHPEHFKIIQRFMQLRTELISYIEEAARKAAHQGIPIMRPTVYDFQDDPNTYEQSFEYMFGDKFLVAPIYKPTSETNIREIYLPGATTTWTHYFNGEKFKGGQVIKLEARLEDIPVLKRG